MHRIGTKAGFGLRWAVPLVGLLATPLWAGSVTRLADERVNVKADRVPLGQLLRELATVTPIPKLVIEPKLEQQPVSAYLEGASVAEAIRKTLEESGVQFLLWGGAGEPLGLYVGDLRKAGLASTADLGPKSREERRAGREQGRSDKGDAVAAAPQPDPTPDEGPPPDSFGALGMAASADSGGAGPGSAAGSPAGGSGGNGGRSGASAPGQAIDGLPPPVRGTASWTEADGKTTHSTGYTIQGDSVVYDDPNFVSFKNSPEARAARQKIDASTLP